MNSFKKLAIIFSVMLTTSSYAGTVKLKSTKFDNICKVQVTVGKSQSNITVKTYANVTKEFSVSGDDRVCYRRSVEAKSCDDEFTEWTCSTRNGSGTSTLIIR